MSLSALLVALMIAVGFASWPVAGIYTKLNSALMVAIVMFATGIFVLMLSSGQVSAIRTVETKSMVLLIAISGINAVAVYYYAAMITDKTISPSAFMVACSVSQVVIVPLLNRVINGIQVTGDQMIGYGFAAVTMYFLTK